MINDFHTTTQTRIEALRAEMQRRHIDLYLLENADPHGSEYLPDHWKEIEWLTGFRGEVALVAVTPSEVLLWTDSRFFLSAESVLQGTGIRLMRMKVEGVPTPTAWLAQYKQTQGTIVTAGDSTLLHVFSPSLSTNLLNAIWIDRPPLPAAPVVCYPTRYSGEETSARIDRVLRQAEAEGLTDGLWVTALDDIAWVTNLRGADICCTPVFVAFLYLARQGSCLFIQRSKLTEAAVQQLTACHIAIRDYAEASTFLASMTGKHLGPSPIALMKAVKNEVEIAGYKEAMRRDGVALTRFYHDLERRLQAGERITETDCADSLIHFRQEQAEYQGESFPAIVAWQAHAAMPHYEPDRTHPTVIAGSGLLLIDTGGQYLCGTTDLTRTIGLGEVTPAMRRDATLVLKGHIRLAEAVFPAGTRGDQLDALARLDLWRDGKTYLHGTSHGVGHYLSVHEGPESVRMEHNPQPLLPGMVFSNEPAIYLSNQYGIRHENCVLVRPFYPENDAPFATPCLQNEMGSFLCLETITYCYFDTTILELSLLSDDERRWINHYHERCYEALAPSLSNDDRRWLADKCKPLPYRNNK